MKRLVALDDFDVDLPRPGGTEVRRKSELEEARLAAFEEGYSAGWEDAARAHAEDQTRISSELGQTLQDLSFTFHEAHAAMSRDLEALLSGLVGIVLPSARERGLAAMIEERALAIGSEMGTVVEVSVAPENVERVKAVAAGLPAPPMRVVGEPTLGGGQASLRFGAAEERIDLDSALTEMRNAVAAFSGEDADSVPSAFGAEPEADGRSAAPVTARSSQIKPVSLSERAAQDRGPAGPPAPREMRGSDRSNPPVSCPADGEERRRA